MLCKLYSQIIIPYGVYLEIENGRAKQYYQDLTKIHWIKIKKVVSPELQYNFPNLDRGELEVLNLAQELKADLVIIDELRGRQVAHELNFSLTGTLGILLKAKQNQLILSVEDLVKELLEKDTWINPKLVLDVLKLAKSL